VDHPLEDPEWKPYLSEEVHQSIPPPPLLPATTSFFFLEVPARAFIKKDIPTGHNPLLSNFVGHIGVRLVYDMDVPLDYMDDILIHTDRGVREATIE
jgi:hypothetical protein